MKPSDLHALWSAPDNTRLTAKQTSIRLPVHVAAKLSALCDLYPNKNRTQIIGDLLATAIDASVGGLQSIRGPLIDKVQDNEGQPLVIYEDVGPLAKFKKAANLHFAEFERELGNDEAGCLYEPNYVFADADGRIEAFTVAY